MGGGAKGEKEETHWEGWRQESSGWRLREEEVEG
jgi:hypothetical protein